MIPDGWMQGLRAGALATVLTLGLAGCAGGTDLNTSTADRLQDEVATIAELAAAGDPTNALATADALQTHLTAALEAGTVSAARADRIRTALDLVRQDLAALLQAATPAPEATAPIVEQPTGDDSGSGDSGDDDSENPGGGNENQGPGNNNGNGPGNSNGNGPGNNNGNGKGKGKGNGG
ncbi:hypothetical protein [Microbacterium sp. GXF7504]